MGHDSSSSTNDIFIPFLDRELKKIDVFYETQERRLLIELQELEELVRLKDDEGPEQRYFDGVDDDDDHESDDDDENTNKSTSRERRRSSPARRRALSDGTSHPPRECPCFSHRSNPNQKNKLLSRPPSHKIRQSQGWPDAIVFPRLTRTPIWRRAWHR